MGLSDRVEIAVEAIVASRWRNPNVCPPRVREQIRADFLTGLEALKPTATDELVATLARKAMNDD